jgi:hypothetical protein
LVDLWGTIYPYIPGRDSTIHLPQNKKKKRKEKIVDFFFFPKVKNLDVSIYYF